MDPFSGNSSLDTLLALLQTEGAKIEEETEVTTFSIFSEIHNTDFYTMLRFSHVFGRTWPIHSWTDPCPWTALLMTTIARGSWHI